MKTQKLITLTMILLVGSTALFAGGSSEEAIPTTERESTTEVISAEWGNHDRSYDIDAVKTHLDAIGLRTFQGEIPAVDFTVPHLGGTSTSLSDYAGSLVFLNFWATWCPPCRAEMPSMEVIHNEFGGEPFKILAVNVQEDAPTVQSFVDEFGYTYSVLLDESGGVAGEYGVRGIPTTYIIGPDGVVLAQLVGTREWDEPEIIDHFSAIFEELAR